ncbi:MAG: hypothetical protein KDK34_16535, partial [Leptospiraceae bacterium]|nr:hypothetical protein [Leptospiraceae bacterium]
AATEVIFLGPEAYREKINQLIRDVYPYGVRVSLRRDYPAEHKEKLAEVHRYLRELAGKLRQRINDHNPPEINKHYNRVCDYLEDITQNDAELTRVV